MLDELDRDADDLTLAEVIDTFLDNREEEIHTALPGRVESYDASWTCWSIDCSSTPTARWQLNRAGSTYVDKKTGFGSRSGCPAGRFQCLAAGAGQHRLIACGNRGR